MFRNPYADGLIILVIVLLFFGPKRLPSLGRSLGQGMREFKDSITGSSHEGDDSERREILPANESPVASSVGGEQAHTAPAQPSREPAERSS